MRRLMEHLTSAAYGLGAGLVLASSIGLFIFALDKAQGLCR